MADIHLAVKINQDIALLKLVLKKLAALNEIQGDVFDHVFLEKYVEGYDKLLSDFKNYDEKELLDLCGVSKEKIEETVLLLVRSNQCSSQMGRWFRSDAVGH